MNWLRQQAEKIAIEEIDRHRKTNTPIDIVDIADSIELMAQKYACEVLLQCMQIERDVDAPEELPWTIHFHIMTSSNTAACFGNCGRYANQQTATDEIDRLIASALASANSL